MLIMRGILFIASLTIVLTNYKGKISNWMKIVVAFWLIYFLRLLYDVFILEVTPSIPCWEIISWGLGVTLIPSLAIYLLARSSSEELNLNTFIYVGVTSLGISLLSFIGNFNPLLDRFSLPDLNPIPAGHAGASLFLICLVNVVNLPLTQTKKINKNLSILGIIIGLFITLSSSTRSAFLSILLGSILIIIIHHNSGSYKIGRIYYLIGTILFSFSLSLLGGSGLIQKLITIGQGESELNRLTLLFSSMKLWFRHPIFGVGFKMHESLGDVFINLNHFYPHNFIAESFLLGGLFLGTLFLIIISYTVKKSFQIILLRPSEGCLVCLWLQGCIYVMVSGHLGNVPLFWLASAAICGRYEALTSRKII